jgi:PAS domain-containing protein
VNTTRIWPPSPINVADREAFRNAMEPQATALSLSSTAIGRVSGKPRFYISRKVVAESGELLGVIAVGLEAEFFADFYRQIALGADSWLALFRNDGTLLATSLPDQPLGERLDKTLPYRLIESGQAGKAVLTKGPFPYYAGSSPTRIVVATRVGTFPAYVTVVVGESTFLTPWRDRNLLIYAIAASLTALTVVAGLGIFRLIERSAAVAREASQREVLSAIVDTPLALTAVADRTGRIIHANSSFRRLFCASGDTDVANVLLDSAHEGVEPLLAFIKGETAMAEVDVDLKKAGDRVRRCRTAAKASSWWDWTRRVGTRPSGRSPSPQSWSRSAR